MQILKDENGNIVQTATVGEIPGGTEIDFSMYRMDENGNLMLDAEKFQAKINTIRALEIRARLAEIDAESIRAVRAVTAGTATSEDTEKLKVLETEAQDLREEMKGIVE